MSSHRHHRPYPRLQLTKVQHSNVSPDDIKSRMMERDRLAALDTCTAAERWLGDPPPKRSALAQRSLARVAKGG